MLQRVIQPASGFLLGKLGLQISELCIASGGRGGQDLHQGLHSAGGYPIVLKDPLKCLLNARNLSFQHTGSGAPLLNRGRLCCLEGILDTANELDTGLSKAIQTKVAHLDATQGLLQALSFLRHVADLIATDLGVLTERDTCGALSRAPRLGYPAQRLLGLLVLVQTVGERCNLSLQHCKLALGLRGILGDRARATCGGTKLGNTLLKAGQTLVGLCRINGDREGGGGVQIFHGAVRGCLYQV